MGTVAALQFITIAILARLLSSSDFGLIGMITVVTGLAQAFADMGISNAIIHRQDATRDQLSSLYWLSIGAGAIVFCVICVSTPLIAGFYREPRLHGLLYLTAAAFLIAPFGQQFQVLLQRDLRFGTLAKIEITTAVVNSTVVMASAFSGLGVYSLIWGQLSAAFARVVLLLHVGRRHWMPGFHFARQDLKGYTSFGIYQMGERAINYLSANIDFILVGRLLGPAPLGFYSLAYQIALFPLTKVNPVITRVAFPSFARVQSDNPLFRKGYSLVVNYISLLSFPMMAGMFVVAPEFIVLFFGAKWEPAVPLLRMFCVIGAFKSLVNPVGSVLLAKGRPDIGFYWNAFVTVAACVAVIVGVHWGINGVASAILILHVPLFFIIQLIVNRLIDMRFIQYVKAVETPAICSIAMLAGVLVLKMSFHNLYLPLLFAVTVITGTVIYLVSFYLKDRPTVRELVSMIKGA